MLERELKLHVPAFSSQAVGAELRALGAVEQRLRARYFDTADRQLAQAGVALRLRLEGDHWVQTAKAHGPDELSRIELNHARPSPVLDLTLYEGTAIAPLLNGLTQPLSMRYETDVLRLKLAQTVQSEPTTSALNDRDAPSPSSHAPYPVSNTATIELAFDVGVVRAGDLALQICELEIELLSGSAGAIFHEGRKWLQAHGLIVDLRSKAERGDLLAGHVNNADVHHSRTAMQSAGHNQTDQARTSGLLLDPYAKGLLRPRRAGSISLSQTMSVRQAYQACLADCVVHVIRNATLLSGVDNQGASQALQGRYVHQLRVGMRRLRTCWKFFGKWVTIRLSNEQLRHAFQLLGSVSDNDVLRFDIAPRLAKAGMPPLPAPAARSIASACEHDPRKMSASADFQLYMLSLLEHLVDVADMAHDEATRKHAHTRPTSRKAAKTTLPLSERLETRLQKWLRELCREGRNFHQNPGYIQHDLRKKLKRLRYSLDFSASVLPKDRLSRIRSLLAPLQHAMGDLNDMYNAWAHYEALSRTTPEAFFALGWLKATQDHLQAQIQADLDRLEASVRS